MSNDIISTSRKAHIINEDQQIYGTLAEIGAGQEVARHFFQAGHASNTIAKTMSAYDMTFSDEIYGKSSRYVSHDRLLLMLKHEFDLLKARLECKDRCFFTFADTSATSSHNEMQTSHAWMGIRFQMRPDGPTNDIVVHAKMLDRLRLQQQEALGILGVNLLYGAWYLSDDEKMFTASLIDNLTTDRIQIDYIKVTGPDFENIDQKLMSLELLVQEMTHALIYDASGEVLQATDYLYNKPVVVLRGTYKPVTKANLDILDRSIDACKKIDLCPLLEFTIHENNDPDQIDYKDYLSRIETINACGLPVLVSNFPLFYQLKTYLRRCTENYIFIVMGSSLLDKLFDESYYTHLQGGLLKALGKLIDDKTRVLVFPFKSQNACTSVKTFSPAAHLNHLYKYLTENNFLTDILGCDDVDTTTHSQHVREMMENKDEKWKDYVPEKVIHLIEQKKLFGN